MVRPCVKCARAASILMLLALTSVGLASEPGFGKVQDGETLRGCGITIGYSGGTRYVLTAHHCLKGDLRFEGRRAAILAQDATLDIALLAVEMPAPSSFPLVAPRGTDAGTGTRYGYPNHKYTEDACGITRDGGLTVNAIPGASGGPIVTKDRFVVGIVTHVDRGVPAHQIRTFLALHGYSWLYPADVARKSAAPDAEGSKAIRRLIKEFQREADEHERILQRHLIQSESNYRDFLKQLKKYP